MKSNKKVRSFLKNYCNYENLKNLIITFDIDWAPDFMIEDLLDLTQEVNLTLFNTHKSKLIEQIDKKKITIGVHPNLQLKSSQGANLIQVKNFVKKIGDIKFLRFHVLGHSYPDLKLFAKHGAQIDTSILLMNQPYLYPNFHNDINLVRVPYIWEDGMVLNFGKNIKKSLNLYIPGIKIINFHPIDIYLNTSNINHRSKFKNSFSSVLKASKKDCEKFINKRNYGIRNFLIDILKIIKIKKLKTTNFKELNHSFRKCL